MSIREIKIYFVDASGRASKNLIFCSVETDDGTVGWGEAYAIPRRERGIAEIMRGLSDMLMSLDDPTPWHFRRNVMDWYDAGHISIDFSSAASAFEVALWDIQGKQAGKPLCELLGHVLTRSIPLYANMDPTTSDESIDQLVERCLAILQQGFNAVKIYPMSYGTLDDATECVRRVRQAIGDENHLLIDVWALASPDIALQAARAFAPYDLYWFEEPVAGERVDEMAEFSRQVDMPVVTGERQVGIHHFRSVLERKAADILNPDIVAAGGVQDMIEIGRMAQSYGARMSPHCWDSTLVATAAMVQTMAVLPNALIGETFPQYATFCAEFGDLDIEIRDSTAIIGDAPGLGVRMDKDALAAHEV